MFTVIPYLHFALYVRSFYHRIMRRPPLKQRLVHAYSYDVIIETAREVQLKSIWQSNEQVKKLQFSSTWVRDLLNRAALRRRKIRREDKLLPSVAQVIAILRIGQDKCREINHDENTIFNMDETAYTWAIGPTHLYVPSDQERASNLGVANAKLRITAVITVGANVAFAPLMIIIKHSVSSKLRPDQSGSHLDIKPLRGLLYTPFWIRWLIDRGVRTSSMQVVLCSKDRITDAIFEGICLTELLSISIVGGNCDISDASLRVIATGCVNLLNIGIVRCPRLTWQSLAAISKHCKGVKSFAMNECN